MTDVCDGVHEKCLLEEMFVCGYWFLVQRLDGAQRPIT